MSRRQCGICSSERAAPVNAFLQAERSPHWIEGKMREMGYPTKAETVRKHLAGCLNGDASHVAILQDAVGEKPAAINPNADFALAIRAEANRALANGTLHITAAHGLQAQALIDRRVEKAADRQLMVQLAGLLSGGSLTPPSDLIEGEWQEVESLSSADPDATMKRAIRELTTTS